MKTKLEEAAEKYYESNIDQSNIPREYYESEIQDLMCGFAHQWQQERSYSEEEVGLLNKMFELYWYENNNQHEDNLEEWELSKRLFEQFKKK